MNDPERGHREPAPKVPQRRGTGGDRRGDASASRWSPRRRGPSRCAGRARGRQKDIFHEYALDFAKKVNDMTGGDLKIEVLPAGAVVPAFGLLDAVSKGTLDGGHGVLVYHYGKQNGAGALGLRPGLRHGREHAAELAQVRRRQASSSTSSTRRSAPTSCRSRTARCRRSRSAGTRSRSPRPMTSRASSSAPSASRSTCSQGWARRSTRCPAPRSSRPWTAACSTPPSSTTRRPTASSASPTSPRSACCRAITRTPSSSRSRSTRRSSTRCRTR